MAYTPFKMKGHALPGPHQNSAPTKLLGALLGGLGALFAPKPGKRLGKAKEKLGGVMGKKE